MIGNNLTFFSQIYNDKKTININNFIQNMINIHNKFHLIKIIQNTSLNVEILIINSFLSLKTKKI